MLNATVNIDISATILRSDGKKVIVKGKEHYFLSALMWSWQ
jgi:hypothetical protein